MEHPEDKNPALADAPYLNGAADDKTLYWSEWLRQGTAELRLAERHRRTKDSNGTTPPRVPDYGEALQLIAGGLQHLDEALPNAQSARTLYAYGALRYGVDALHEYLRNAGVVSSLTWESGGFLYAGQARPSEDVRGRRLYVSTQEHYAELAAKAVAHDNFFREATALEAQSLRELVDSLRRTEEKWLSEQDLVKLTKQEFQDLTLRAESGSVMSSICTAFKEAFPSVDFSRPVVIVNKTSGNYRIVPDSERPSVVYRPKLSIDGNKWCALYGEDLQDGVAGFGDSPNEAMEDFDRNWAAKLQEFNKAQEPSTTGEKK